MTDNHKSDFGKRETLETDSLRDIPLNSLKMKQLIELDACTRCGECLTWCPVYDQDTKEAIIPRRKVIDFLKIAKAQQGILAKILRSEKISNPLKAMLGRIFRYRKIGKAEIDDFVQNLYECSTCGQCEVVCPAHIETVMLWEELRRVIVQAGYGPLEAQKALVKSVKAFDNPWQQPRAARVKWARRAKKDGLIQKLPREIKKTKAKVLLFFGCTASYDVNVKQVAINTINILEALNIDYGILGSEEKCCASVLLRMGDPEHERVFKENIDLFNSLGIETLISSCSGCFKTIMQDYPRVAPLNFEVLHTIEYLARLLKQGHLDFPYSVNRTVTFHDPCHLGRATGGFDAPRMIMEAIPGLNLVEMPRNKEYSRCCGAGGGLKAGFPDIQNKMAQRRVKEAEETGADNLVSCCPFCFQGLNIGITAMESHLMMKDMSSLVAESLLGYDVFEKSSEGAALKVKNKEKKTNITATTSDRNSKTVIRMKSDDRPASRKAEKEHKRAEKRAARRKKPQQKADSMPPVTQQDGPVDNAPTVKAPITDVADPSDDKKAEKKRKRAERRAARRKKPLQKTDSMPPDTQQDGPVDHAPTVKAPITDVADPSDDKKAEKKRKRAERRAAREKEKEVRRAARR